jgi:hypothetical protein
MPDVSCTLSTTYALVMTHFKHLVCPHVSFSNPQVSSEVPPRESVETRSLVITKEEDL